MLNFVPLLVCCFKHHNMNSVPHKGNYKRDNRLKHSVIVYCFLKYSSRAPTGHVSVSIIVFLLTRKQPLWDVSKYIYSYKDPLPPNNKRYNILEFGVTNHTQNHCQICRTMVKLKESLSIFLIHVSIKNYEASINLELLNLQKLVDMLGF